MGEKHRRLVTNQTSQNLTAGGYSAGTGLCWMTLRAARSWLSLCTRLSQHKWYGNVAAWAHFSSSPTRYFGLALLKWLCDAVHRDQGRRKMLHSRREVCQWRVKDTIWVFLIIQTPNANRMGTINRPPLTGSLHDFIILLGVRREKESPDNHPRLPQQDVSKWGSRISLLMNPLLITMNCYSR